MNHTIEIQNNEKENISSAICAWEETSQKMEQVKAESSRIMTSLYWMGIKMSNNKDKFEDAEIEYVDFLYTGFESLVDMNDEILKELKSMKGVIQKLEDSPQQEEDTVYRSEWISKLQQEQDSCRVRMQSCINMNESLQENMDEFCRILHNRPDVKKEKQGRNITFLKKVKSVHGR